MSPFGAEQHFDVDQVLQINDYLKYVFGTHAVNKKIDQMGLLRVLQALNYDLTAEEIEWTTTLFDKRGSICFCCFMHIFSFIDQKKPSIRKSILDGSLESEK